MLARSAARRMDYSAAIRFLSVAATMFGAACAGAAPVSFSRQVLPLLRAQCWSCHSGPSPASGYSMETRDRLLAGGRHGAAVLPGKGGASPLVQYMTGELKPKMPPAGAIDLERIGVIRKWIDEGAKVDSMTSAPGSVGAARKAPTISTSAIIQAAPVTAVAFSPDGKRLAVGGYRTVRLIDPAAGTLVQALTGPVDQVQALAWSSDGRLLAAGGGEPGKSGEVVIYDAASWRVVRTLTGHSEVVYAVAWRPGSNEVATGSLDKTAQIWDTATGKSVRTIKDHAEAVFGVAYSPDGKLFATASGDRSAKLFDTSSWKRTDTLNAHQDALTHVSFNPAGTLLATVGADRQMKVWKVAPGKMENPERGLGEGDTINACSFSPDGKMLVWSASNGVVRVFNGDGGNQIREMKDAKDWVYCLDVGADSDTVAAGTQEGKVYLWSIKQSRLLRTLTMLPGGLKVESSAEVKR